MLAGGRGLEVYGELERPGRFIINQIKMQVRKRFT